MFGRATIRLGICPHSSFMSFLMSGCDEMLKSVFMHKAAAVNLVHGRFASYVCGGA